jgi:hypothetical protein
MAILISNSWRPKKVGIRTQFLRRVYCQTYGKYATCIRLQSTYVVTFGDKINLSNTTNANSTRVEIDSDANSVALSWWETNKTSDMPVMRISNDNGKTFGDIVKLSANGPIK